MTEGMNTFARWLGLNRGANLKRRGSKKGGRGRHRLRLEELEKRDCPSVGGGFTAGGLEGQYFANTNLSGTPAFTRSDVRIDFDWGTTASPGGSISNGFNSIGHNNFSVVWTGQIVPSFSETYTFQTTSDDGVQLFVRPTGTTNWALVVNDGTSHPATVDNGAFAMTAGSSYDVKLEYYQTTGAAVIKLAWSSPSTPLEIIDPLAQTGINNPDLASGLTDIVKGARNSWTGPNWGANSPGTDANGWPTADAGYVFQESLNQGLGIDPLMLGTISFSFNGSAVVSISGNVNASSLSYSYNAATNTTSGTFSTTDNGINASLISFTNSHRNGQANGPGGITNLEMMRPIAPNAMTSYSSGVLFDAPLEQAMSQYTLIRFQLVANQQMNWSDRTLPGYFNQANGNNTAPHDGNGQASNDGPSWEYKVMLANETGRDLLISLPVLATGESPADTSSYIYNLANLLRYGSDQNGNPYTSPQANPIYPPLNPNLRVYLELGNELWNYAGVFDTDYANLNSLTTATVNARGADYQVINYDNQSTAVSGGNYVSLDTWRYREVVLRMVQISNIFRSVWGDPEMMSHVRPLYEWQYANDNNTASTALTFADNYFDNADGQQHVTNPQPISYYIWGGGGASYYGASNPEGLTGLLPDNNFASPALSSPGYLADPSGSPWTYNGTAGIAAPGASVPSVPPAFNGSQVGYVTDNGSMSISVTFPSTQTSNVYGVAFKAVNYIPAGSSTANTETIRVYLDGVDITARTASQGNGYTPPGYNSGEPWMAQNVYWTWSDYYYTNSFTIVPGSTHTITVKGMDAAGSKQTIFIGDFRVTSVDAIFASTIPAGGEATGQPATGSIQSTLNTEADWALAYGLQQFAYEGGWSLGGDDGGSPVQLQAKYNDPRTAQVQQAYMNDFAQSGSSIDVLGTYSQWPSWSDFYGKQGLLNANQYPLVQGVDADENALPAVPTNGTMIPGTLSGGTAVISNNASATAGQIWGKAGFLDWNIIVPATGTYTINLATAGSGATLAFVADDTVNIANGSSGGALSGTISLTKGLHSLKVSDLSSGGFSVSQISVAAAGHLSAPTIGSAVAGNGAVTLSWNAVAGATAYKVGYGTSNGIYTGSVNVGSVLSYTLNGLANGQIYYFVVSALTASGVSGPLSGSASATPQAPVTVGVPSLTSAVAQNGAVVLTWSSAANAAGYGVEYGTTSGSYGQPINVGNSLTYTATGLNNGQVYYFAVCGYSSTGTSGTASTPVSAMPIAPAQTGSLVAWDLAGYQGAEAGALATSVSAGVTVTPIVRGPLLTPHTWPYYGDGSAFAGIAVTHAQTLSQAQSMGEYYQFTVAAAKGDSLSLGNLQFHFFVQNHSAMLNDMSLAWSTDGVNFTTAPALSIANTWVSDNLSSVSALQGTTAQVTVRLYVFGNAPYEMNGFYGAAGNDIILAGLVAAAPAVLPASPVVSSVVLNGNNSALAGVQRSMVESIVYHFSEAVNLNSTAFTIAVHNGESGTLPTLAWSTPDNGLSWIVTFSGSGVVGNSIANGIYDITLHAAGVATAAGQQMTGDRTDTFYRLFGDATGSQNVNSADSLLFQSAFGSRTTSSNYLAYFDCNNDGRINAFDLNVFKGDYGVVFSGFTATI